METIQKKPNVMFVTHLFLAQIVELLKDAEPVFFTMVFIPFHGEGHNAE
jgi:hypothetical protein